jgi:hypothetical protein
LLCHQQLRGGASDLVDLGAQRCPAKLACAHQALEAVDELDRTRVAVTHHRDELAIARQRPTVRSELGERNRSDDSCSPSPASSIVAALATSLPMPPPW